MRTSKWARPCGSPESMLTIKIPIGAGRNAEFGERPLIEQAQIAPGGANFSAFAQNRGGLGDTRDQATTTRPPCIRDDIAGLGARTNECFLAAACAHADLRCGRGALAAAGLHKGAQVAAALPQQFSVR